MFYFVQFPCFCLFNLIVFLFIFSVLFSISVFLFVQYVCVFLFDLCFCVFNLIVVFSICVFARSISMFCSFNLSVCLIVFVCLLAVFVQFQCCYSISVFLFVNFSAVCSICGFVQSHFRSLFFCSYNLTVFVPVSLILFVQYH